MKVIWNFSKNILNYERKKLWYEDDRFVKIIYLHIITFLSHNLEYYIDMLERLRDT